MGDGESQAEPQGLQDLQLLDGLLARGRQDAQCAPVELQEDGCCRCPPEGQEDEGGGACQCRIVLTISWDKSIHMQKKQIRS